MRYLRSAAATNVNTAASFGIVVGTLKINFAIYLGLHKILVPISLRGLLQVQYLLMRSKIAIFIGRLAYNVDGARCISQNI